MAVNKIETTPLKQEFDEIISKNFKNVTEISRVKNQDNETIGTQFGYLNREEGNITLKHWREGKKYFTQWCMDDRNTGQAVISREPINIGNKARDKDIRNNMPKFVDLDPEEIESFISEVIETANHFGEELFFSRNTKVENSQGVVQVSMFESYPENVKQKASSVFKDNPMEYFLDTLNLLHIGDVECKELLILIHFTKHVKNGKSVHAIMTGSPDSGKTSLVNKTGLIAPERFLTETSFMSSKALFYLKDTFREDYNHFILNDFMDSPDTIGTLKSMTDTEIKKPKHLTVTDKNEGAELEIEGINTVMVTAATQVYDRELNRRLLHLNPDESDEQKDKVKEFIINNEAGVTEDDHREEIEICRAIYEKVIEENFGVVIPFLGALNPKTLSNTDIKHFVNLVKARALIYRAKRFKLNDNFILASLEDISRVAELWNHISELQASFLPATAFQIVELLPEWNWEEYNEIYEKKHYGLKINPIAKKLRKSPETIKRWVLGHEDQPGLREMGYIYAQKDGDSKTSPWILYKNRELISTNKEEQTYPVKHSWMCNDLLKHIDKIDVIRPICHLLTKGKIYNKIEKEAIATSVNEKFNREIESDNDILKICELVKEEIESKFEIMNNNKLNVNTSENVETEIIIHKH